MISKLLLWGIIAAALWFGVHSCTGGNVPLPVAALRTPLPQEAGAGTAEWSRTFKITVRANETTVYGMPWDSVGVAGFMLDGVFMRTPFSSPPDMVLCIVSATAYECHWRGTAAEPESFCHDSFACDWHVRAPREPFGIIIIDLDSIIGQILHDLVDAAVFAAQDEQRTGLDDALRALLPRLSSTEIDAPRWLAASQSLTLFPGEKKRRQRAFPVLDPRACANSPCKLVQSEIRIQKE
jgi:hypothetical protein